jgi:hypothetical protein
MRRTIPLLLLATCADQPPPDPIDVTGKVFATDDFQVTALEGAPVEIRRGDELLAEATTDAEGAFAATILDGAQTDAFVSVETGAHQPTRAYPGALAGGEELLLVVADAAELAEWYDAVGESWSASRRTIIVAVTDAGFDAIESATVEVEPAPGALVYYDPDAPGWDPSSTAAENGFALAASTAERVTITASTGTSATVPAEAGALTMAVVRP